MCSPLSKSRRTHPLIEFLPEAGGGTANFSTPWETELQKLKEGSSLTSALTLERRRPGAMSPSAMERSLSVVRSPNRATWEERHTHYVGVRTCIKSRIKLRSPVRSSRVRVKWCQTVMKQIQRLKFGVGAMVIQSSTSRSQ